MEHRNVDRRGLAGTGRQIPIRALLSERGMDIAHRWSALDRRIFVHLDIEILYRFRRKTRIDARLGNDCREFLSRFFLWMTIKHRRHYRTPATRLLNVAIEAQRDAFGIGIKRKPP